MTNDISQKITVTRHCNMCGSPHDIQMTKDQLERIAQGRELIQDILPSPEYTAEQRELFISGLDQKCWDELFSDDDEEDDYTPCTDPNEC